MRPQMWLSWPQQGRLVEVVAHELVEQQALDPAHLQDGIPLPADADALFEVLEIDGEGQARCLEATADFAVAFAQAGDLAGEALDGPLAVAGGAVEFVDVGEVAGARHGHAQGVGGRLAAAQLRVR